MKTYTQEELKEILELHQKWLNNEGGIRANLSGANLLRTIGDMQSVKSFQVEKYMITYTDAILNIGCRSYTIDEWNNFTNKQVSDMDNGSLEWWSKWKPIIMQIIKMSPAESTSKENND